MQKGAHTAKFKNFVIKVMGLVLWIAISPNERLKVGIRTYVRTSAFDRRSPQRSIKLIAKKKPTTKNVIFSTDCPLLFDKHVHSHVATALSRIVP